MNKLEGVIVPIVTPLKDDGTLDYSGLSLLAKWLIEKDVNALFVGGTTGEFLALPKAIRVETYKYVVEAAEKKVPVLAGIGATCVEDIIYYADAAYTSGADYCVLISPLFFPFGDEEMYRFFMRIIDIINLPLVLYNIPEFTKNEISLPVIEELSKCPGIVAIKQSGGDLDFFSELLQRCQGPDFKVFMGNKMLMGKALKMGADGITAGPGNILPDACVSLYRAAKESNWAKVHEEQQNISRAMDLISASGNYLEIIKYMKRKLQQQGICEGGMSQIFASSSFVAGSRS